MFWDKRYFLLNGHYLTYRKKKASVKLHASINLSQVREWECVGQTRIEEA